MVLPLIFIAANPEPASVSQAMAAGAFAFLAKPFDHEKLASSLERALADDAA
jgi:DNA-binding NtrC family response regulator